MAVALMLALVAVAGPTAPAVAEGGSVSGRVTLPAGMDRGRLPEVRVSALGEDPWSVVSTMAAADGTYTLPVSRPSQVVVDPPAGTGLLREYYDGAHRPQGARTVDPAGRHLQGIDVQLDRGGWVSGRVSVPPGYSPTQWSVVVGSRDDADDLRWGPVSADGTYVVDALPAGGYDVGFAGAGVEYWDDSPTQEGATPVVVALGQATTGVDAALKVTTYQQASGPHFAATGAPVTVSTRLTTRDGTTPSGGVEVVGPGGVIGRGQLDGDGVVAITTAGLPAGHHTLTVRYLGTEVHEQSTAEVSLWVSDPAPLTVTRVEPPSGSIRGGTRVTVHGTGFSLETGTVMFGDQAETAITVVSPTEIQVTAPPGAGGTVPVAVRSWREQSPPAAAAAFTYARVVTQTPVRVLDSDRTGVVCTPLAGTGGVPVGASGVMMNVTTVAPSGPGYVVVYPDTDGTGRTPPPDGSTVNFETGTDVANSAFVALPPDGRVCYATRGASRVRILLDVTGYTLPGSGLTTQTPRRLVDTRPGALHVGPVVGPVEPRTVYTVQVAGRAGVPVDATSVLLNVTVTGATAGGNLRVFPGGGRVPSTSVVNYAAGRDKASSTVVGLVDGAVSFYSDSPVGTDASPVQVILDVVGHTGAGSDVVTVDPTRILDTRPASRVGPVAGPLAPRTVHSVPVAGLAPVPDGATAVVLHVTAIGPTAAGNLRVYPDSGGDGRTAPPEASSVNYVPGRDIPNQVVVALPADGRVDVYSDMDAGSTHVAVDVVGYVTGG